MIDPNAINDEQPSDDAMDRLWAALDASLDPPTPARATTTNRRGPAAPQPGGKHACRCLRCGWEWWARISHPRHCAFCRSSYWDIPPQRANARRPDQMDAQEVRRIRERNVDDRRRYRHLAKVKGLAKELGLDITDPRSGTRLVRTRRDAKALRAALPAEPTSLNGVAEPETHNPMDANMSQPRTTWPMVAARGRTVPPPPGLDDLEGTDAK
jgi:hypothetical protein